MENRKETTIEERKLVIKLSNEGKSQRNIAKVVGRSVNCIQKLLQKFKKTGMLENNEGRGRKKIMKFIQPSEELYIKNGVRRVLRKAGYNGRVARKKPLIGKRHRVKRLKFAKEHILKPQQFWNEVIFSDELSSTSSAVTVVRAVQKHQITSKEQLKSVLQEEWLNIAPETTRHLVESMPRRLEAVISAKGYATKY
ncbi:HTH_Tnp_Tc3_2 domain-containing protein [Trichonephila clavipes]|nr:HTH_Tnp_Tc3_2 domain-containing protein [Trichonephila clavipes]